MKKIFRKFFNIKQNKELIKSGNLYKGIILVSLPLMLSNFIHTVYNLADTFWVTKISDTSFEVASVSLVFPIIMLMLTIGMGLSVSATTMISQYIGADDKENANKVVSQLVLVSLVLGIVMGAILYTIADPVVRLMAGSETVLIQNSIDYLRVISLQAPLFFVFMIYQSSKQGQGDTITPLFYTFIGNILNIVLDPFFILTLGMGVKGAAIATVLAKAIFIIPIIKLFTDKSSIHVDLKYIKPQWDFMQKIIKISFPVMIAQSMSSLGFAFLNTFINSYGATVLTAFSVGNRVTSVFMMPVMGMGGALATFVGVAVGADNIKRAKDAFKVSTVLSVSMGVLFTFLLIILRFKATAIFINPVSDAYTFALSSEYLIFVALCLVPMGIFQNLQGVFNGSGHTKYSLFIAIGRLWAIRLPIIWYASTMTNLGHQIIWWAMLVSNVIIVTVGLGIYKKGKWEQKVI